MTTNPPTTSYTAPAAKKTGKAAFIAAMIVLSLAAVGLNGATQFLQLHFKKFPVPLRAGHELTTIASNLGPWRQVSKDQPLDPELQQALGTQICIFRDFVDTRLVPKDQLAKLDDPALSLQDRKKWLMELQSRNPIAVVNLAVTYYTGLVDTVAHIPDRCYIADGYVPKDYQIVKWPIGKQQTPIEVRFINFEDSTGYSQITRNVCYFFHTNGHYESDPIGVRTTLQDLRQKYGYYAKIEVMNLVPDPTDSAKAMTDFLACAIPEIERCMPDWAMVQKGQLQ